MSAIHKLTKNGSTIFPASTTDAIVHPPVAASVTDMIKEYNVSELFPTEIFNAEEPGIDSIPHAIVFVFDGSSDDVIQKEDETFYKELVNISKRKGYESIHIILTRIDIFEKFISQG